MFKTDLIHNRPFRTYRHPREHERCPIIKPIYQLFSCLGALNRAELRPCIELRRDISLSICPLSIKNHAFKKTEDDVRVTRNEAHAQLKLYRLFVVCQGW